jgi:hypothetical protein
MLPEIIDKLYAHLSRPISDEPDVVYLMVEIRKAMDRQNSASRYRGLRLFSNWVAHILLEHKSNSAEHLLRAK